MTGGTETITIAPHPLIQKMTEDFNKNGIRIADGAFGDMDDCAAVVESVSVPPPGEPGGSFVKFYGCDFKLKGYPEKRMVEGFGLPKAMVSVLPREILYRSWTLQLAFLWLFIFRRKRFIELLSSYFGQIYRHSIQTMGISPTRYSPPVFEIRRAAYFALNQEVLKRGLSLIPNRGYLEHYEFGLLKDRAYFNLVSDIAEFFCFLFEVDSAYRLRVQDILGELNKDNLQKHFFKEINRLFKIELQREMVEIDPALGKESPGTVRTKIKILGMMLQVFLFLSPFFKRVFKNTLLNLDLNKVKLDEDDWYFCLRRKQYNFKGIPLEERLKEKERIDKERGHIMFNLRPKTDGSMEIGLPKEVLDNWVASQKK